VFLIYKKEGGFIIGAVPLIGEPSMFLKNNPKANEIDYIEISENDLPVDDIKNYKIVSGSIIKMSKNDKDNWERIKNPLKRIDNLVIENALLYSALAEMSILSAQLEQQNVETQKAIAELSILIAKINGGII